MSTGDPAPPTRRAKIVATIGPASCEPAQLGALLEAGMDVARLNFSHGTHEDHRRTFEDLRRLAGERDRPLAILQDLQGPKIRIGALPGGAVRLADDDGVRLIATASRDAETANDDGAAIPTPYAELPEVVHPGDDILLSDGLIRFRVVAVEGAAGDALVFVAGTPASQRGTTNLMKLHVAGTRLD